MLATHGVVELQIVSGKALKRGLSDLAIVLSRMQTYRTVSRHGKTMPEARLYPAGLEQLADYFGVTRPALSKEIGKLVDEGFIKVSRGKVRILNKAALTCML